MENLGKGFGHGIAGNLGIAGECVDGAPQPFRVGAVHGLDALARVQHGHCTVHR